MSLASTQLAPKRLELLRELIPDVSSIGYFVNRRLSPSADSSVQELAAAAVAMGREIVVLDTHTDEDIQFIHRQILRVRQLYKLVLRQLSSEQPWTSRCLLSSKVKLRGLASARSNQVGVSRDQQSASSLES